MAETEGAGAEAEPITTAQPISPLRTIGPVFNRFGNIFQHHGLPVFALLILLIGIGVIQVGGTYIADRNAAVVKASQPVKVSPKAIAGLNITVPNSEVDAKIKAITEQPATITVGTQTKQISPDVIRSWLQIIPNNKKDVTYISIKPANINTSLTGMAQKYAKDPVNQVVVNHGAGDEVVINGRNGAALTNIETLKAQSHDTAKSVMDAKGLQFNTPLETAAFQSVTPAAFSKLIEVDVVTKQMYLYDNGNLSYSYPISAGAPETPTPIGQFKTYTKLSKQDMRGNNADGTKYFQPNVPWIMYFLPGGYGIHGNYWRPGSWFGNINSSHGCVSLPVSQAKQVYDWAPVGTTIITHY